MRIVLAWHGHEVYELGNISPYTKSSL